MSRLPFASSLVACFVVVGCTASADKKAELPAKTSGANPATKVAEAKPVAPIESEQPTELSDAVSNPTSEVSTTAIAVGSRLTGEIDAPRKSQIAFRVGGFVETIIAKPGTVAKKGDVLATIDDRDYKIRAELAKARFEQARVARDAAGKDYEREVQLKKENASTDAALDRMKMQFDSAKLALRLAELDLESATLALSDTKLVAPYDCIVAEQMKHEGENVPSGTAVFEIYDTAEPEVTLTVPEKLMGQVPVGTGLNVSVPATGFSGKAEVVRFVPIISDRTRTFRVTARLLSPDARIVPGSYAEATFN